MRTALQKHPCKSQINFIQPIINNIDDINFSWVGIGVNMYSRSL